MGQTQTSADFVLAHVHAKGWATPAAIQKTVTNMGLSFSRQSIMVALKRLLKDGKIKRLGRGAYAGKDFSVNSGLMADLRAFIVRSSTPVVERVPSRQFVGKWDEFHKWRPHNPDTLAKAYLLDTGVDLPKEFFSVELKSLLAEGLMEDAELGPSYRGLYWATAEGRQWAEMLS